MITIPNYPPVRRRVAPVTKEDIPRDTSRHEHPTSTPYGLKRVAGAIGKQISTLKATVAKFKKMRLPRRLSIFRAASTKEATLPQMDRPLLAEQPKTTKGPSLPAPSFHSPEEDPKLEKEPFKIFSIGLGPVSENDVVQHGEIAPPKATPEARLPSILEL